MDLARLQAFIINCLHAWGVSSMTTALKRIAARPFELLARLGVA
ncbi:MAG: hypothetical protein KatS3mg070_0016 [Meiothermus sp.]|nr:MAG: hypothetical protein KatS3mg070_0016 [Meiothermus sp.]